jgi:hypothetical protein
VKILAQSRETIRQVIKLPLYGLTEEEASQESFFDHALECMDTALTNMVGRSVSIYPEGEDGGSRSMSGMGGMSGSRASLGASLGASLSSGSRGSRGGSRGALGAVPFLGVNPNDGTPLMYVSYVIDFLPLKPFKAPCELIISKASGGRWRHSVLLESTEPEVDDVIVIEGKKAKKKDWAKKGCTDFFYFSTIHAALLNSTSSVSFKLTNQYAAYAPFTATFTPDSPYEFTCFPNEGVLEPPNRGKRKWRKLWPLSMF